MKLGEHGYTTMNPDVLRLVLQVIAWVVFAFAMGLISFGLWLWFGTGSQDIAGIVGAFFIGGGAVLAFPSFSVGRTGRFRGL